MVECRNWKPGDVLRATGIPPHVHILLNTTEISEHQKRIPDLVSVKVVEALEERNQLFRNASKDDVRQFIMDAVQIALGGGAQEPEILPDAQPRAPRPASAEADRPQLYLTDKNKMTRIPPDFTLPSGNLQTAWSWYCCWDDQRKIPPLRAVFGHELSRSLSARFASYRTLMEAILKEAQKQGVWEETTDPAKAKDILKHVDLSGILPVRSPGGRIRRLDQLNWTTLANDFYATRQKLLQKPPTDDPQDGDDEETDDDEMADA